MKGPKVVLEWESFERDKMCVTEDGTMLRNGHVEGHREMCGFRIADLVSENKRLVAALTEAAELCVDAATDIRALREKALKGGDAERCDQS